VNHLTTCMPAWLAAVLTALMVLPMSAGTADAHAVLIASTPSDGAVLSTAPDRVTLTFSEPVSPLRLRLVGPDGPINLESRQEGESTVAVIMPSALQKGSHVLSWRVVSLDGHPVGGTTSFSVGAPNERVGRAPVVPTNDAIRLALWACKVILYLGLFVGVGGSVFVAWFAPGSTANGRGIVKSALTVGLIAAPVLIGLQGADALDLPLSGLADRVTWMVGFDTSFGLTVIVALSALLAGFIVLNAAGKTARGLSLFGAAVAALALCLSGHAATASPQWLTKSAVFIHAAAQLFWIGALVPLASSMRSKVGGKAALLKFSRAIPWAILALVASGILLAIVQIETADALITTAYGRLLCVKIGLVTALLALGAWNRRSLTPAVVGGNVEARGRLARSISIEIALAIGVFFVAAAWRFTPPPRALAIASDVPVHAHLHGVAAMADVTISPRRAGLVNVTIIVSKSDFATLVAQDVSVQLENSGAGLDAIVRPAALHSDGSWRATDIPVPLAGLWDLRVEILIDDFEKTTIAGTVKIGSRE